MKFMILILAVFVGSVSAEEKRDHYYAVNDGYKYAYELRNSSEMIVIYYLGEKDNTHQIMVRDGDDRTFYESKEGSKFANVYEYWIRDFTGSSMIKLAPNTIATQAFLDAWNGRLKQMVTDNTTTWIDGENGPKFTKLTNH